jgi:hypothetical protein
MTATEKKLELNLTDAKSNQDLTTKKAAREDLLEWEDPDIAVKDAKTTNNSDYREDAAKSMVSAAGEQGDDYLVTNDVEEVFGMRRDKDKDGCLSYKWTVTIGYYMSFLGLGLVYASLGPIMLALTK